MVGSIIPIRVLMTQMIANLSDELRLALGIPRGYRSIGLLSSDCDDATYMALDEATKASNVDVVYAKSLYAGAGNASTKYAGEVIGIIAGKTPSEVLSGIRRAVCFLESGVGFRSANGEDSVVYLAHCVSRTGTYLSKSAGVSVGEPLAYLVAPPVEAIVGLDAAMKAADVRLCTMYQPPTETNFAGGLLTGTQSACKAACEAFAQAVTEAAAHPMISGG